LELVLEEFSEVFSDEPGDTERVRMTINTTNCQPSAVIDQVIRGSTNNRTL